MQIDWKQITAVKFKSNGLVGIYLHLELSCPACRHFQSLGSTGFLLGGERMLPDAVEEIRKELYGVYAACSHCGVRSKIVPDDVKPEFHHWLVTKITGEWYSDANITNIQPPKIQGICGN